MPGATRRKTNKRNRQFVLVDEIVFWTSAAITGYVLLLPLMATASPASVEHLLQVRPFLQLLMIGVLPLGALSILTSLTASGEKRLVLYFGGLAWLFILFSLQSPVECCSRILAWAAGLLPTQDLRWFDLLSHLMPMIGGGLLMLAIHFKTARS